MSLCMVHVSRDACAGGLLRFQIYACYTRHMYPLYAHVCTCGHREMYSNYWHQQCHQALVLETIASRSSHDELSDRCWAT